MAVPSNKKELLSFSDEELENLLNLVGAVDPKNLDQKGVNEEWSVNDVLAHLNVWHEMFLVWYVDGMKGKDVEIPAPGFTWKTTPDLNHQIYSENKSREHDEIVRSLKKSHKKVLEKISDMTDKQLYTKKMFGWTGTSSVGVYARGALSSHYVWAQKLIKKWMKANS